MSYKITIPEPCNEDWNQMTATQKGAYCKSCAKEVIDFTRISKSELARKIKHGQNLCGRFKPEQLNTPLPSVTRSNFQRNAAMLGFTSLLSLSNPLAAQEKKANDTIFISSNTKLEGNLTCTTAKPPAPQVVGRIAVQPLIPPKENVIEVFGVITDGNLPLPGANVFIKGTQIGTSADFDGNFQLGISNFYKNSKVTLVISYLGFVTMEKEVVLNSESVTLSMTEMEEDAMGEMVILYKPNIFKRIGNLFRRKY